MTREIPLKDGRSFFRVENNGKVRLIIKKESSNQDIVVYTGHYNEIKKILLLSKTTKSFLPKSFTLGIPLELYRELSVKTVAIDIVNTGEKEPILCADHSTVALFGYTDSKHNGSVHEYLFLDYEKWHKVETLADLITFHEGEKQ